MTDYSNPSEVEWGEHLDRIADDHDTHAPVEYCPTCSHTLAEHTEAGCEAPSRVPVGGRWPRCYCDVTPEADGDVTECEVCGTTEHVRRVDTDPHGQMDICDNCYDEGQQQSA